MNPLNSEEAVMETVTFDNRPPIRVRKSEIHEKWLGYVYLDFGGRRLYGVKTKAGVLLWEHTNPAYDTDKPATTFLGRYAATDAARLKAELFDACGGDAVTWVAETFGLPDLIETID